MTLERSTQACGLKVDGGVFTDLARVPELAGELEQQGYDACWTGEINHDPFLPLLLAAEHTSRLELGTSIAVAFARNPMTVANVGWDLQTYSQGPLHSGPGYPGQAAHREAIQHAVEPSGGPDARVRACATGDLVGVEGRHPAAVRG